MKIYEGIVLKRRLTRFIISELMMLLIIVFMFLYNTLTTNVVFRMFYILVIPELGMVVAYLVYIGFGKDLDQ